MSKSIVIGACSLLCLAASFSGVAHALPTQLLLQQLDDVSFSKRENAQHQLTLLLKKGSKQDLAQAKTFFEQTDLPEVKSRLGTVLDSFDYTAIPNTRGFLGITMQQGNKGVLVGTVHKGTAAAKANLLPGDEVLLLDGHDLTNMRARGVSPIDFFSTYVKKKNAGQKLQLKILRAGKQMDLTFKLGNYDDFNKGKFEIRRFGGPQLQLRNNGIQINPRMLKFKQIPRQEIPPKLQKQLQKQIDELNLKLEGDDWGKEPFKPAPFNVDPLKKKTKNLMEKGKFQLENLHKVHPIDPFQPDTK